ncbi:hypothetical protein DMH04_52900 [Kibdelosporangium aridum]|uniref:Uncharacterized protein n=1 Tax=Kibdelosporangium aridum TaxID=2030 RepID=A0A428Y3I1_KIBAR|nr:nucleotidyl transferase AbiEii/AbiGii toxin family protein [Kibdelosporangium aridum]RSM62145.1 hypothetical protein DMH04_52900 [Kibdelosporangium aridum]
MFGLRQLGMVSVDIVVAGLQPMGDLLVGGLEAPFTMDCSDWPAVRMWPLEDHVADKIAAMYELHGDRQRPSSRFKDLVDLMVIAVKSPVDGATTYAALTAEVDRRRAAGTNVVLPEKFVVPDPSWTAGYRAAAARAYELPTEYRTLGGAVPLAEAFVAPLLQQQGPQGAWNTKRLVWC